MAGQDDVRTTPTIDSIKIKHFYFIMLEKLGINVVIYNSFVTVMLKVIFFYSTKPVYGVKQNYKTKIL